MKRGILFAILASLILSGCVSGAKPADSAKKAEGKTVHLVGTIYMFNFNDKDKMVETAPGIYELPWKTPAASKESWVTTKNPDATHAVKFIINKDWNQGYIGEGFTGPMVLDNAMQNLNLPLVEGTTYLYKVDLNTMTYAITPQ